MTRTPVPPITVVDGYDVEVFPDVADACTSREIYGVHDLTLLDSAGYRLRAETSGYDVVDMVVVDDAEPIPEFLGERLRGHIRAVGPGRVGLADYENASIEELLDALLRADDLGPEYEGLSGVIQRLWRRMFGR